MTAAKNVDIALENVEVFAYEKRQVFDLPPVSLIVTEHRSQIKSCPHCGKLNKAVFPESIKYRVQYGPNILASAIYCKIINLKKLAVLKIQCWENGIILSTQKINFEFTAN